MTIEEANVLTNGIQRLFFSLSTHLMVSLWNEFLDDESLNNSGEDVENFRIHPNENEFFEEAFCDAIALLYVVQNSRHYKVEHGYVVYDALFDTLKSFNDPCIFIQDHADGVNFWDWFYKKIVSALNDSVKGEE